ncbi:MAG: cation transporter [Acidobacteria bacterium]|nr:cation transporter [Acidobacteriota bacterium]MCG3191254.1 Ferrous-iron efflux pump FieF [Thermoanaerobaculia bacterium]
MASTRKTDSPARFALLSIAAAVVTIALKTVAYLMTGSVGLLSDAVESVVNLLAALVAFWALKFASRPADEDHAFGHTKAEYLASGFEGLAIMGASGAIAATAVIRLKHLEPLENVGVGLLVSVAASAINGVVAWVLFRAGKRLNSITLRADAHHLMTDVWTSVGVLIAVLVVKLTGWLVLDPLIALVVAANILLTAMRLLIETGHGLLDRAVPRSEQAVLESALVPFRERGIVVHALRTRSAGPLRFIDMHVLVPGLWTVKEGHDICEEIERSIRQALPRTSVLTHLEPIEDPASFEEPP